MATGSFKLPHTASRAKLPPRSDQAARSGPTGAHDIDLTGLPLTAPVSIFEGFKTAPLPDAITALLYRTASMPDASGIERFARRLMAHIDCERLRSLSSLAPLNMLFLSPSRSIYINVDGSALSPDDLVFIHGVETALNRVLGVLEALGFGMGPATASPSEEACAVLDQRALCGTTSRVEDLLAQAVQSNPWARPGSAACKPGGEWDVRCRLAHLCEGLNLVTHLDYLFWVNTQTRTVRISYTVPDESAMPRETFDTRRGIWRPAGVAERTYAARELAARMAIVLSACGFAGSLMIRRCIIEQRDLADPARGETFIIPRDAFMGELVPRAHELDGAPLSASGARDALARFQIAGELGPVNPTAMLAAPREDARSLSPALGRLLMADAASELEVMEQEERGMRDVSSLHEQAKTDPEGALRGLFVLVGRYEAVCAAQELMSDTPLLNRFCENYLGRILLPLMERDPFARIARAPDALFFAECEICGIYARAGAHNRALIEARKLVELAPTSMQAWFSLVNAAARLDLYDEVVDACKKGLRVACTHDAISYLLYRLAYALWRTGDRETALACYVLMPPGEEMSGPARNEMRALLAEMRRGEAFTQEEATEHTRRAGIPIPPSTDAVRQILDAAVLLTDGGFFFLASHCVHAAWRITGDDELGAVWRSLAIKG